MEKNLDLQLEEIQKTTITEARKRWAANQEQEAET
jgi:hypothetical protein